ncbi:SDR family oxidoreductase [Vampirovibrio chlorellavorus]|uniref:SDR family oxidoreductase n=1 Tax=Vampirovibrio chlorellavorus TaxID=758823 RepID=UPI0026EDA890|nr:SDR family oxidoreductase [Vampirovibrio chlorellavorus]
MSLSQSAPPEQAPTPSVLISGASSGIGLRCAAFLAEKGYRVFAGYRHPPDADKLATRHPGITPVPLELTSQSSIEKAVNVITEALNGAGLNGLVNNAGVVISGPLEFVSLADWRHQLDVNLIGPVTLTRQCLPLLRQSQGRIVNIGSVAGIMTLPFLCPYSVSKLGLAALSDALRVELKPWGIQVALIEPGNIHTPIWAKSLQTAKTAESHYPPDYTKLYGQVMDHVKAASQKAAAHSIEADVVAQAVYHALSAPRAKTRYPLGLSVQIRRLLSMLPDRVRDWLIARQLGL